MGQIIEISGQQKTNGYLAVPDEGSPIKGAIIVIHEIWGLNDHTKDVADRFANEGFIALAPNLLSDLDFSSLDINQLQQDLFNDATRSEAQGKLFNIIKPIQSPKFAVSTVSKLKDCFNYLYDLPKSNQKVAITGFCFGGTYSFSLAVNEPRLFMALPFYGHVNHTVEELKNIKCPIQAFYGQNDQTLVFDLPKIKELMNNAGVDFKAKVYENCGHAFFNDTNPKTFNKEARDDSWKTILSLLKSNE